MRIYNVCVFKTKGLGTLQRKTGKDSENGCRQRGHALCPAQHKLHTQTCPHGRNITHPATSDSIHTTHSRLSVMQAEDATASAPRRTSSSSLMMLTISGRRWRRGSRQRSAMLKSAATRSARCTSQLARLSRCTKSLSAEPSSSSYKECKSL